MYLLSLIDDEEKFLTMRKQLFDRLTFSESQVANRSITANVDHDNFNDEIDSKQQEINRESSHRLIVYYTHEQRLKDIKRDSHEVWSLTFNNRFPMNMKLIVGSRSNKSSKIELVHTQPSLSLITMKNKKSE